MKNNQDKLVSTETALNNFLDLEDIENKPKRKKEIIRSDEGLIERIDKKLLSEDGRELILENL